MKLVVEEPESASLASALAARAPQATSIVGEIEFRRACLRAVPPPPVERIEAVLAPVSAIALDNEIANAAAALRPILLRSLDAIHVATALALGAGLEAVVTYDARLAKAAEAAGLTVLSPR